MPYDTAMLRAELSRDEGRKTHPYTDTVGKLTIGVGWNLTDNGIPEEIIDRLLDIGISDAERDARAVYPDFDSLSDKRQRVLLNMAFNMGRTRLSGFANMLRNLKNGDYEKTAEEMLDSRWAVQVGPRSQRLAAMMREG